MDGCGVVVGRCGSSRVLVTTIVEGPSKLKCFGTVASTLENHYETLNKIVSER